MPAASQGPELLVARIRSAGFVQGDGGTGESVSLNLKSPSAASGWAPELWALNVAGGPGLVWQKSVAATRVTPSGDPMLFPPAKTRPFPSTLISPSCSTLASNFLITQGVPPGDTPRTTFAPPPATTGMTPIPPSNSASPPALTDGASIRTPGNTSIEPINHLLFIG